MKFLKFITIDEQSKSFQISNSENKPQAYWLSYCL